MYTAFYHLRVKPFQISSDPAFIWLGEKHREALATLKYGVLDNKGFLLLTGDVGTGKTTLINTLIASLSSDVIYASVSDPRLEKLDFFNYIAAAFGIDGEFSSKGKFLLRFSQFLHDAHGRHKKILLIIDESQLLTQELLEEIRLLSNIDTAESHLLNIFFVGQNEFNNILANPENRAVAQRLTLNYHIEPLNRAETGHYITHRLEVAGAAVQLFDDSAIREIHAYSGGFPRRINIICDHCLLTGFVKEKRLIDAGIVRDCAKDLKIPTSLKPPGPPRPTGRAAAAAVQPAPGLAARAERRRGRVLSLRTLNGGLLVVLALALLFIVFPGLLAPVNEQTREAVPIGQPGPVTGVPGPAEEAAVTGIPAPPVEEEAAGEGDGEAGRATSPPEPAAPETPPAGDLLAVSPPEQPGRGVAESGFAEKPGGSGPLGAANPVEERRIEPPEPPPAEGHSLKPERQTVLHVAPLIDRPAFLPEPGQDGLRGGEPAVAAGARSDGPALPPLPETPVFVRFDHDSNDFKPEDIDTMEEFARILRRHPETIVTITGHTDAVGSEGYNAKLSEFRANIVKGFLLGQGLAAEQMRVQGLGSRYPVDTNETIQGRRQNRRVEIRAVPE